jgi:ribose 5-phosphate isomerase A
VPTQQEQKIEAARAALENVTAAMSLGLGSGSTAEEFVKLLAASPFAKSVRCTCTSKKTERLAQSLGIATFALAEISPLDLAIDGADEIDPQLRLIKGHGGALLREKIVEQQAKRFIVIADESKLVERLGRRPLPVEITPFALDVLMKRFADLSPKLREGFTTDEGNVIVDVRVPEAEDIAHTVQRIRDHAGVIDTGFFPDEATEAIIATPSGIKRMTR